MSQSELHQELVEAVAARIKERFAEAQVLIDIQSAPGDEVPPIIESYRPDVYARSRAMEEIIIAEAKTPRDVNSRRSLEQLSAFLRHLGRMDRGSLILSVPGHCADLAKSTLRFLHHESETRQTTLEVFDQCDFWTLEHSNGHLWHLY